MPLSAFQQFCADTGCPDNVHTLALWTQRNDAVAKMNELQEAFDLVKSLHIKATIDYVDMRKDRDKLKAEREQMGEQELSHETLVECIAGSISKHICQPLLTREVLDAARYIANNYAHPPVPDGKVPVDSAVFDVRRWPRSYHDAWNQNIPDVQKAFEELLKAAQQGE